jgi:hypothetical protein
MTSEELSPITLVACPEDRAVVPDPAVHYRPQAIHGRHYSPTPITPEPPAAKPTTE